MNTLEQQGSHVLYVTACGSPSASLVQGFVIQAQAGGWDVCVITTPNGRTFLNMPLLAHLPRTEP